MPIVHCIACESPAGDGVHHGDSTQYECPRCGGYRLAGTAVAQLQNGRLSRPDPIAFAQIVKRRRGGSAEYPLITSGDLGG